ncbi:MAG: energy transducer TonB [Marinilabiliaceae bacterium]|nr:energy transducer TonB [Marinilabiliaceae bacterium]
MKQLVSAVLVLSISALASAQNLQDTMYVDKDYNFVSKADNAKHKVLFNKKDGGLTQLLIFSPEGRFQGEANYKHFSYGKESRIREGRFSKTYVNGGDSLVVIYKDDEAVWPKVVNYPSGKKWFEYESDRTVSSYTKITAYYENGAVKSREQTVRNSIGICETTGHSYDENGNEIEFKPFYAAPKFIKGDLELLQNVYKILRYPKELKKKRLEGDVTVSITIDKNGAPIAYRVVQSDNESFSREALKAYKAATENELFTPATIDGTPIKATYIGKIHFNRN